ncbi:MAG: divalent-cation tolerance protein CutA [Candidatus Omnitrophica bacterium]|nr:divalent-cation tolerance protein CutA [Candidatus Omnitrophota bacterium]MCF7895106.1 divalent-cation tolerance protein CutA [Candidatus Omnitrophota bacterium]
MIVILITAPNNAAKSIARALLDKRLCACVNIVDSVTSLFLWQNKIDTEKESLLIVKTADSLFERVEKEVLAIHPYDLPEIISFKLNKASKPYQDWLNKELGF